MAFLMGIDLGTSSLKTLIMNEAGNVCALSARDYQFDSPINGYAEQQPEVWWEACRETAKEAIAKSGIDAKDIAAVSFSGQMHGAVMLDKEFKSVRPAILHCDARSSAQVAWMKERLGAQRAAKLVMNPIYTGFLLPSLLWVRDNEPANYERIAHVMLPKDYLKFKLSGEISSDFSDSSATLAYDIKSYRWSGEILESVDVPKALFPSCYETCARAGSVCGEAAEQTGLRAGTAVVAGGGDQIMQGMGNGITAVGGVSVNIGSSGQVSFQCDAPVENPKLSTNTICGYERGRWVTMGAVMSAGLSLKWCNRLLAQSDYAQINDMVAAVPPGSGGLIYLPYLNGERTPHLEPNISGEFVGVNINTGRAEFTRAVMEGVAYSLMQCIEVCSGLGLSPQYMVASGGGAKSAPWLQIQSDIYGMPLKISKTSEQAAYGAAIAAAVGAGIYESVSAACAELVQYEERITEPNMANHEIYKEYYKLYKNIYKASKEVLMQVTLMGRNQKA